MKPRERVLKTLKHEPIDRVPLFEIWIEEEMAKELGEKDLPSTYVNLGLDCIFIPYQNPPHSNAWRDGVDEWGRVWRRGIYVGGLVANEQDLKKFSPPLDYVDEFFDEDKIKEVKRTYPDHCLIFGSHVGPFTASYLSMGFERFFISLLENPSLVHRVLEKRTEWCLAIYRRAISLGIDVAVLGDDVAHKSGTMVSPEMWRTFGLPYHLLLLRELDFPFIWHSDGNIIPFLPMAVEAGFSGVHGLEPSAGIELARVKKEYGKELVLVGNADINPLFGSDPERVRKEVVRCLRQGASAGGYMFSSCNSIFKGMNPFLIREMYRWARKQGKHKDKED